MTSPEREWPRRPEREWPRRPEREWSRRPEREWKIAKKNNLLLARSIFNEPISSAPCVRKTGVLAPNSVPISTPIIGGENLLYREGELLF